MKTMKDVRPGSIVDRAIKAFKNFDKAMLYIEVVTIPLSNLKSLQENQIDIISMMEKEGMTSYCQAITNLEGKVYSSVCVVDPNNEETLVENIYTFLSNITNIEAEASIVEKEESESLKCKVISKVTAMEVVVSINNKIRRYELEDFMRSFIMTY